MSDHDPPVADRKSLQRAFREWHENGSSDSIYTHLSGIIAQDAQLLDLYEDLPAEKLRPVLLFAAVHFLILQGAQHKLARIYEAPTAKTSVQEAPVQFKDFCDEFHDEIVQVMRKRNIQTNEVNRCIGLVPALMVVTRKVSRPLGLIEMGSSAGLGLLFDRFRYDYGGDSVVGLPGSNVRCHTTLRGPAPPYQSSISEVDYRIGIDIDPPDINDEDDVLWLRACIWVGDIGRDQRLTAAVELARREWPEVVRGDVLTTLKAEVAKVPYDLELVLYNCWMMAWMSPELRGELTLLIEDIGRTRPLWWISYEWPSMVAAFADEPDRPDASLLGIQHITAHGSEAQVLARIGQHGNWLEWVHGS